MNPQREFSLDKPRSASELISAIFTLYQRFFWLFPVLAVAVIVPYEGIILLVDGASPLVSGIVVGLAAAVFGGFATALLATAVGQIRDGVRPRLGDVFRLSLRTLPMVIGVALATFVVVGIGFLLFFIPGIYVAVRWAVGIPVAAIEGKDTGAALRRSADLSRGRYLHILGFGALVLLILFAPILIVGGIFQHPTTASFIVIAFCQAILMSFSALAQILLYFDLAARYGPEPVLQSEPPQSPPTGPASAAPLPAAPTGESSEPVDQPYDPFNFSDEDRPSGWYVDPDRPWRMRYWRTEGDARGWSKETTKTPEDAQSRWRDLRWRR